MFQVEFSLLIALLGPLEGSAIKKVRGILMQYPTVQVAMYLQQGDFREITTKNDEQTLQRWHVT